MFLRFSHPKPKNEGVPPWWQVWCHSQAPHTYRRMHTPRLAASNLPHTHTYQRTGRVWAMLCNKRRGSDVVGAAPRAIVEKPHERFWVLKDKPRSAGRKSVMRGENSFPPPPSNFFLNLPSPSSQVPSFTKVSLLCPLFFSFLLRSA